MVTRNHFALNGPLRSKQNDYGQKTDFLGTFLRMKDFALPVAFIKMLHPKKPASVVFLRNTYVDGIEWLRVTITF